MLLLPSFQKFLQRGELSRFEDEGIGGEFGIWTDAIAFAENRIASYVPTGSGFVRTWSLSESNEIVRIWRCCIHLNTVA